MFIGLNSSPLFIQLSMHPTIRNILAIVAGFVAGAIVNMGLIMLSGSIIPPPAGADLTTPEGLKAAQDLLEPKHFIFPFLAHALGTLAGAFIAAWIATSNKMRLAYVIGFITLAGGIYAAYLIPAPAWFVALDLLVAYIPMAFLGGKLGSRMSAPSA
jgi:hypothetical protein